MLRLENKSYFYSVVIRTVNSLLSRLGWSIPPFKQPLRVWVVAEEAAVGPLLRHLRAAKALVQVGPPPVGPNPADVVLLDLRMRDAWAWLDRRTIAPVIALVEHEATGMKALLRGAAGVLNLQKVHSTELLGSIQRVVAQYPRQDTCEAIRERTEQVLHTIEHSVAACSR